MRGTIHARVLGLSVVVALSASGCGRPSGPDASAPSLAPSRTGITVASPVAPGGGPFAGPFEAVIAFPPRNEPYDFRQQLEVKYRDGLRRGLTQTYVDLEGDIVWTQEYLRYRVNACDHASAIAKVFAQIDGQGILPVCGSVSSRQVAFPPRNEPYDFRRQLEIKYRDGLRRSPTSTYVDIEGDIVWTQEYLRYRVNACDHATAAAKVFAQIDGRGIQPDCTALSIDDLGGVWNGTSSYINAPFVLSITQIGSSLVGTYSDQHDFGSAQATLNQLPGVKINVNFGDTGIVLDGAVVDGRTVSGVIRVPVLGNRLFPYTMTR